jgi:hypothetical protein
MSSKIKYNNMISSLLSSTQRRSARMFATISAAVAPQKISAMCRKLLEDWAIFFGRFGCEAIFRAVNRDVFIGY